MPYVEDLLPLTGYESSSVVDINDEGKAVGTSFDANEQSWTTASRATLWSGQAAIHLRKVPAPNYDPSIAYPCEAMRVDASGRVLCRMDLGGGEYSYYLWLSETEPAIDLSESILDLKDVIDLNDNGVLLFTLKSQSGRLALQAVDGSSQTLLPPYPATGSNYHPAVPLGVDNSSRVVAYWPAKSGFATKPPAILVRYWSSAADAWIDLYSEPYLWVVPVLAKRGYVLLTHDDDGRAYFHDLGANPQTAHKIPAGQNVSGSRSFYLDVNADDVFVGGEGNPGSYTPTRYKKGDSSATLLESAYPDPDWDPTHAVGNTAHRIVGEGYTGPGGRPRAWKLILNTPTPGPNPFVGRKPPRTSAIDPKAALLGATSRWYVLITKPDPAPFDLLSELVASLRPEERRLAVSQVREISARFEVLAKMLREADVSA